ncbi:glucoamylase [Acidipropionibacterium acidipropionici]|uniref:Glucoamylase S1/S2 n=2 Tax=Acidipropionibacterium acidipropionici TaxID=1748 RepID=A0AAC8YC59_9ACTN|nr:hypothetical protein [Acidipropionibacterium acidipropionici]AMS04206.1 hypothetical protein AXH35_00590 [Acidipropionibacterium acidipropionici]AZP38291.1 glucoamylase [Acidipropionibacterium acidipropionici]
MTSPQWPSPDQRPQASIDQYAPPRRRGGWIFVVIVVVVAVGLVLAVRQLNRDPRPPTAVSSPASASSPASSMPAVPTPGATASSIPFVSSSDGAEGVWTITKVSWSDSGAEISMTIKVTKGTLYGYSFYVMENDSTRIHEAEPQGWPDDISGGSIRSGQTVSGRIFVDMAKVESTVVLAHDNGMSPITALLLPV